MTSLELGIAVIHVMATASMGGVIWFVQIVHYPLFGFVGRGVFPEYEQRHVARTGRVVGPLMLAEAGCAVALAVLLEPGSLAHVLSIVGLVVLVLIWLSTFTIQVPLHRRLEGGQDQAVIRQLVRTNWIRTVLWTLRSAASIWILLLIARSSAGGS